MRQVFGKRLFAAPGGLPNPLDLAIRLEQICRAACIETGCGL
jgi:hypothetical protein